MTRTVITSLAELDRELPTWYGLGFAFDTETTGLDYAKDRLLGASFTFEDERSYYVVCEHTVPQTETVVHEDVVQVPTDEVEEYEHVTPSGKVKRKTRPVFRAEVQRREEVVTTYPPREFVPREAFAARVRGLFAQHDVLMVAHNAKFDLHFLARLGIKVRGKLADTVLASKLIDENRAAGLKDLCRLVGMELDHFQDLEHYPGFPKEAILGVPLELAADYAIADTEATWRLWQRFETELVEEGVEDVFRDGWMPLTVVLQEMEARGIALDIGQVRAFRDEYAAKRDEHARNIWRAGMEMLTDKVGMYDEWEDALSPSQLKPLREVVPNPADYADAENVEVDGVVLPILRKANKAYQPRVPWFNPGSNDQLRELLYDYLGLEPPRDLKLKVNRSTGEVGVDKDTIVCLKHAMGDEAPPLLDDLLGFRKTDKLLGTYLDVYLERADPEDHHCIRTWFNQDVARTGRLSSSGPNLNCRGTVG